MRQKIFALLISILIFIFFLIWIWIWIWIWIFIFIFIFILLLTSNLTKSFSNSTFDEMFGWSLIQFESYLIIINSSLHIEYFYQM